MLALSAESNALLVVSTGMTRLILYSFPFFVYIRLNLFDLLFSQMFEPTLLQEVLLDRETAWFTIDRVSFSIFHFIKRKDFGFHGKN